MSWLDWLRKKVDAPQTDSGAVQETVPEMEDALPDPPRPGSDDTASELAGLDFYSAIATHQRWKNRLKDVVNGQSTESLDAAEAGRCDACALGIWLEAQTDDARVPPHLLEQLKLEHAQFHKLAADIIRLSDQGRAEEALQSP
ncbi:MAG: CZB domain-containing protein, partial [Thiomonas sp.]|nr:CZB domain-containing protein [Thiomonas sp.]